MVCSQSLLLSNCNCLKMGSTTRSSACLQLVFNFALVWLSLQESEQSYLLDRYLFLGSSSISFAMLLSKDENEDSPSSGNLVCLMCFSPVYQVKLDSQVMDRNLAICYLLQQQQQTIQIVMETGQSDSASKDLVEQKYRWVIVVVYGLLNTVIGINTVNVPPIATTLEALYGVNSFLINIIAMIYLVVFAITNLPANYFIDDHGIRVGLWIGCILLTIGNGFQMMVNINFSFMVIGSVFIATAQPFINNCAAKIATFWFFKQNRTKIVTILTLVNLVGAGIGFVIPALIVNQHSTTDVGKKQVFDLQLLQFSIACASSILVLLLIKNKPENAPSLGSQAQKTAFKESISALMANKNFLKLFIGYFFFLGPLNAFGGVLNFMLKPYHFTNIQISIFGIIILTAGLIGSATATMFVSKTLKYTLVNRILTAAGVMTVTFTILQLNYFNTFGLTLFIIFLLGFFITPLFPLGADFGCEVAFPVGEAQITGLLIGGGYVCSFFLIMTLQFGVGFGTTGQSTTGFVIFAVMMGIGVLFYWTVKNDLRRRNLEEVEQPKQQPNIEIELIQKEGQNLIDKKQSPVL